MKKYSIKKQLAVTGYLFILPFVIYILITSIGPIIYGFVKSFFSYSLLGESHFIGLEVYKSIFKDSIFWNSLKNTGLFFLICIPIEIAISLFLSVLLSYGINPKLRTFFRSIYFVPFITSLVAAGFVWKWIYDPKWGPLDQYLVSLGLPKIMFLNNLTTVIPSLSIVHIWVRIGFSMVIFIAGLESIPVTFYEAATIDGASRWKIFTKITLPLLNPQLVIVLIYETISVLKIFDIPYVMTNGGPANRSRSIVLHIYETSFTSGKINAGLAMSMILLIVVIVISIIQWKITRRMIEY